MRPSSRADRSLAVAPNAIHAAVATPTASVVQNLTGQAFIGDNNLLLGQGGRNVGHRENCRARGNRQYDADKQDAGQPVH